MPGRSQELLPETVAKQTEAQLLAVRARLHDRLELQAMADRDQHQPLSRTVLSLARSADSSGRGAGPPAIPRYCVPPTLPLPQHLEASGP